MSICLRFRNWELTALLCSSASRLYSAFCCAACFLRVSETQRGQTRRDL